MYLDHPMSDLMVKRLIRKDLHHRYRSISQSTKIRLWMYEEAEAVRDMKYLPEDWGCRNDGFRKRALQDDLRDTENRHWHSPNSLELYRSRWCRDN